MTNGEKDFALVSGHPLPLYAQGVIAGRASMRKEVVERLSDLTAEAGAVCPTYEGVMYLLDKLIEELEAP